jgi:hypothetical protein
MTIHVFYAGLLYATYEQVKDMSTVDLPDGAYIRYGDGVWTFKNLGSFTINRADVPNDLKTLCLLMGLTI